MTIAPTGIVYGPSASPWTLAGIPESLRRAAMIHASYKSDTRKMQTGSFMRSAYRSARDTSPAPSRRRVGPLTYNLLDLRVTLRSML